MPPPPFSAPDVCIVDDDPEVGLALGRFLRSVGYRVESYSSAEAFLLDHPRADAGLLVVDVRMPGMTGPELQRSLAALGATTPMLFISAVDDRRVQDEVLTAGAVGWLRKPVDGDLLLERVAALVARPGSQRAPIASP